MSGPLTGYKVIELAGIGPGPYAAMMLNDMGADVIRVDRSSMVGSSSRGSDVLSRGRRSIGLDLKHPDGVAALLRLVDTADVLLEGFRPGVMERMGLGPEVCLDRNPRLVFGRMTGWGQEGPYALTAGHDINYIALAGVLAHCGRADEPPTPPMNLVGDFGGGGMFLAFGVVSALLERERSGLGQVVDAAMVDGAASLMSFIWGYRNMGMWDPDLRGGNMLDTGAHYYDTYECADGKYVSVGSIEPQFYDILLDKLGLTDDAEFKRARVGLDLRKDKADVRWANLKERLRGLFLTKTQAQWCELLEYTDACFAPVLTMTEAAQHPHNVQRGTFVEHDGVMQPSPAPRFSRTPGAIQRPASVPGDATREVLTECGYSADEIEQLLKAGAAR